jgi:tetraacyldisaccharide 4'-kinase
MIDLWEDGGGTSPATSAVSAALLGAARTALMPLEWVYAAGAGLHRTAYRVGVLHAFRAACPVISVGNLTVGGTGKTPVTAWLARRLSDMGASPAVLHGGYGNDEQALHARWNPDVPVYAGRTRTTSAKRAVADGASVLLLDDGFQHYALLRDVDIVLVSAERWSAHPRLLPAGAWREPPSALGRAQVVAVTRRTATAPLAAHVLEQAARYAPGAVRIQLALEGRGWRQWTALPGTGTGEPPQTPGVLVAGVAQPAAFTEMAAAGGAHFLHRMIFRDHHAYDARDAERICAVARGGPVFTTEKDAVKLAVLAPDLDLWVLVLDVVVERGEAELLQTLQRVAGK